MRTRARLLLLSAALLFSTGGAAVKFVGAAPAQVACVRSVLAAAFLFGVLPPARRRLSGVREFSVALAFAFTMLLFVLASRATTATNAVFLQASAPLYLLLLGPLLLKEKLERRSLLTLAGMAIGLALFFSAPSSSTASAPRPLLGNSLGALAGATWALSILAVRSKKACGETKPSLLQQAG